jgi:Zn-dependent peptidase ImmA (M78 family)
MIEQKGKAAAGTAISTLRPEKGERRQFMERRRSLVMGAADAALRVRQSMRLGIWIPICIYDVAEELGLEVRFVDISSMEGMYCKTATPLILVSSLRPSGRQAFTCAHELGHHIYKHGTRIDELVDQPTAKSRFDPEEFLADCFAGFLLMPKSAISRAFATRGWDVRSCTPLQLYTIAGAFGVGYTTLIQHLSTTLNLLPRSRVSELVRVSPKQIRSVLLGRGTREDLVLVDTQWVGRAIDIQVGDLVQLPADVVSEGLCISLSEQGKEGLLFRGAAPGVGRFHQPSTGWSASVRVSRRDYIGRSIFRHLEEADDDD